MPRPWAKKIEGANDNKKVEWHIKRFQVWKKFIYDYAKGKKYTVVQTNIRITGNFSKNVGIPKQDDTLIPIAFGKLTLKLKAKIMVIFDASFGSIDPTSDLDIAVYAETVDVVNAWADWLQKEYKNSTVYGTMTFTKYWDSNFYFEPSKHINNKLNTLSMYYLTKLLPTSKTARQTIELIDKYANSYINQTALRVDGRTLFASPFSPGFNQTAEINQYRSQSIFGQRCLTKMNIENEQNLSCAKTEGLLCAASKAICGVFGPQLKSKFIRDTTDNIWRLCAAYEMLMNLKMHKSSQKFKAKYLQRFSNALKSDPNACKKKDKPRIIADALALTGVSLKKKAGSSSSIRIVNSIIQDEINGTDCLEQKDANESLKKNGDLDKNIKVFREYIMKRIKTGAAKVIQKVVRARKAMKVMKALKKKKKKRYYNENDFLSEGPAFFRTFVKI